MLVEVQEGWGWFDEGEVGICEAMWVWIRLV